MSQGRISGEVAVTTPILIFKKEYPSWDRVNE